jgi:hypothetical protein
MPKHISSFLQIKCVGPPTNSFVPSIYVKSLIIYGKRYKEETRCCKIIKLEEKPHAYLNLKNHFNRLGVFL